MISAALRALTGSWQGTNRLWLDPAKPAQESEGTAVFQLVAQKKFATLRYTWAYDKQPQEGFLLFGEDDQEITAAWVDSWHMQDKMMHCTGKIAANGAISVVGYYAAPPDPDWGWRITIEPQSANQFTFRMHNITPQGEEMLAVEVQFKRST